MINKNILQKKRLAAANHVLTNQRQLFQNRVIILVCQTSNFNVPSVFYFITWAAGGHFCELILSFFFRRNSLGLWRLLKEDPQLADKK